MNIVKSFSECISTGIARSITADPNRANSLYEESQRKFKSLFEKVEKIGVRDDNANDYIEHCYDSLIQLIRARMFLDGFMASGQGAHEAEVAYLLELHFATNDIAFMNQLRYFRNGILYYGTALDAFYAQKVITFTKRMHPRLAKLIL